MDAVRLARRAEKYIPEEVARVRQTWLRFRIGTKPAGARVEIKNYSDLSGPWEDFGASPVDLLIPMGYYRMRVTKAGFVPLEIGAMTRPQEITLAPEQDRHAGMVPVAGGDASHGVAGTVRLTPYWIDRLEVTNRDYKTFVDAGGYRDQKYWTVPFRRGDRPETFDTAMTHFRDTTNRPGPSTWELGTFPEGQGDFPVGGVSWFEAAAYARFAGKRLPTIYHWFQAAGADEVYSDILVLSNFDGKGPARAGERPGVGPFGTFDMAGNVKEWCANEATGTARRYILGGGWNEPSYRFTEAEARDPWERGATFGLRLIDDPSAPAVADAAIGNVVPDPNTVVPVSDSEFEFIKRFYTYDRAPLDAQVTAVDDSSPDWKKETITFAAAYGGERVPAYFFTPKHATPPYQTLVLFPTAYARNVPSSARLDLATFDFLVKSGRAVLYPVYQGTFERRGNVSSGESGIRDMNVQSAKDFFRGVDYLETRADVDTAHLGYYAVSMGAYFAPIAIALEPRIKAAVVIAGGLRFNSPEEVQPANFMPRVKVPLLMLNGRDDFGASFEAQQRYLALLGSTEKQHKVLDGGHVPAHWRAVIRETLDWYDKYLGPVR
jgi:formylglycine-generating enzyme required for sulfatase activity/dienelactone hydrolase